MLPKDLLDDTQIFGQVESHQMAHSSDNMNESGGTTDRASTAGSVTMRGINFLSYVYVQRILRIIHL